MTADSCLPVDYEDFSHRINALKAQKAIQAIRAQKWLLYAKHFVKLCVSFSATITHMEGKQSFFDYKIAIVIIS